MTEKCNCGWQVQDFNCQICGGIITNTPVENELTQSEMMCARLSAFNRIKTAEEILETGEWYREHLSEEENETYHKYLEVFLLENKSIFHKLSNRLRP